MAKTLFRALDGILLLDKPPGLSSNQALQRARHLFRAQKGGHTGALDPLATGLLPLCFGEATKVAGLLLGGHKAYRAGIALGVTTDTDDADGSVLRERPVPALTPEVVLDALGAFLGRIRQRPPIYSALKQGGEALYAKARRGEDIQVPEREVQVDAIELLGLAGHHLELAVTCGSGTYIRSIARDLGEALGCGGHVTALRRTWVDPFRTPRMHTLEALEALDEPSRDALLLPVEAGLAHWPSLALEPEDARRLGLGQAVAVPGALPGPELNVTDLSGRSLGFGRVGEDGLLRPRRLFRWAAGA